VDSNRGLRALRVELSVALLGPSFAIYATDIILRRNRYNGCQLHDETPSSPFWYHRGVNSAGVCAQALGTGVALMCANTSLLVGPIAHALDGADLCGLSGPVVAAAVYATLSLRGRRRRPGKRPLPVQRRSMRAMDGAESEPIQTVPSSSRTPVAM
jgi:NCS1 family nucleobase:cation symporter-1